MRKSLWILIIAGLATHFLFFGHPSQTVFDEVHFGKFVSGYYTGEYYFDIHPPLGKLLIAGFGKIFDFRPEFSFANIGDEFLDSKYMALRFLPSLAGSFIPAVIFLLALQLGFSRRTAFTAGALMVLENGLLVQTRFILMDGFLILFGFLSLLLYFKKKPIPAGILAGMAASIKWTGVTFLALILILEAIKLFRAKDIRGILPSAAKLIAIPFIVYFSVFALHFALLTRPGPGDAYMSQGFHDKNIAEKFTELNLEMYRSNQRLTSEHSYSSRWYSWPFMARPIFYWVDGDARIYFLGNPIIWWASTAGILMGFVVLLFKRADKTIMFLAGAYLLNLLPFMEIKRVMFLYHYMIAMIFAVLMLAYVIEKIYDDNEAKKILIGLVLVSFASFLYFAPLSYGLNLSPERYERRVLLPGWR